MPELSDRGGEDIDLKIISALKHTNDQFLRTGLPRTETFLLLALKIFDYESVIVGSLKRGRIVIEDRSIDTIAVYQSIMLCSENTDQTLQTANAIYELASKWRRVPDVTFLIEDDFDIAITRAQKRLGRRFNREELLILKRASSIYSEYASIHSDRMIRLDRRTMSDAQVLLKMRQSLMRNS